MVREILGERKRIILLLQAVIEDVAAAVVGIATKLYIRDNGQ